MSPEVRNSKVFLVGWRNECDASCDVGENTFINEVWQGRIRVHKKEIIGSNSTFGVRV